MRMLAIALGASLVSYSGPTLAKPYIMQFGASYEVWDTRGLYDYPIQGEIKTEREARKIARDLRTQRRGR